MISLKHQYTNKRCIQLFPHTPSRICYAYFGQKRAGLTLEPLLDQVELEIHQEDSADDCLSEICIKNDISDRLLSFKGYWHGKWNFAGLTETLAGEQDSRDLQEALKSDCLVEI